MTSNPPLASPSSSPGPAPGSRTAQPSLGEFVARILENIIGLVKGEIDLAKAKGIFFYALHFKI